MSTFSAERTHSRYGDEVPPPVGVQAHRGYSGRYPENTLLAFEKAIEAGADVIEIDIHASNDGVVFVIHDATVDRTTDGTGRLSDLTYDEIKALDAGAWFDQQFAGERVPTLAEVLDQVRDRIQVNVEIKASGGSVKKVRQAIEGALNIVDDRNLFDQVFFSSFSLDALYWTKRLERRARIALLDWDQETFLDRQQAVLSMEGQGWLPRATMVTKDRVALAQQRGLFVISGGGNDPKTRRESVLALKDAGVNFISTNYPAEVIEILREEA